MADCRLQIPNEREDKDRSVGPSVPRSVGHLDQSDRSVNSEVVRQFGGKV